MPGVNGDVGHSAEQTFPFSTAPKVTQCVSSAVWYTKPGSVSTEQCHAFKGQQCLVISYRKGISVRVA